MSGGARMGKVELTSERHFLKIPRELHFCLGLIYLLLSYILFSQICSLTV